jgi:hypothetical protein
VPLPVPVLVLSPEVVEDIDLPDEMPMVPLRAAE